MIARNHTGHRIGECHGLAKHKDATVKRARELNKGGNGCVRIGKELNVNPSTVADWLSYETRWVK